MIGYFIYNSGKLPPLELGLLRECWLEVGSEFAAHNSNLNRTSHVYTGRVVTELLVVKIRRDTSRRTASTPKQHKMHDNYNEETRHPEQTTLMIDAQK